MLKYKILIQLFVMRFMLLYCVCGDTIRVVVVVVVLLITYLCIPL